MTVKLIAGVNFTNVLQAAFTPADPKSGKKLLNLTVFFALSGSAGVKAARRTLMKLTPGDREYGEDVYLRRNRIAETGSTRVDPWRLKRMWFSC